MENLTSEIIILCPNKCELAHQDRTAAMWEQRILYTALSTIQLHRGCCAVRNVKLIGHKGTEPKRQLDYMLCK